MTHTTAKMEYNVSSCNCTDYIVGRQLVSPAAPCVVTCSCRRCLRL